MSGQLGELVISLQADMGRFREDMGKANKIAQDNAKSISGHFDAMGGAVKAATGLLIGFAGAASFGALIKSTIDAADNMSKMSQKIGVNIQELSGMAYAAGLADVSTESLGKGMGKLNKAMYDAQQGGKGSVETFDALGVSVVDASGKLRKSDEVMFDIADRFAGMDDGAKKTALSMEVFGKAGADMIPLLNGGAAGLKEATDEARRFGLVLDEEAGKRAEEFNDNLTRMKSQVIGAGMAIANELLPEMLELMDRFSKGGDIRNGPFIQGLHSVQAEIRRVAMLADKAGGSLTSVGMLLYGPGSALGYKPSVERFENMAKWNMEFEKRYAENEKAMQTMANLEVGLDADGNPFKPSGAAASKGSGGGSSGGSGGRSAAESRLAASRVKDQKALEAAAKAANAELRQMSILLEGDARRDGDLSGFGSGLINNTLTAPSPKDPAFSLLGKSETMGYGGNSTSPAVVGAQADADAILKIQQKLQGDMNAARNLQDAIGGFNYGSQLADSIAAYENETASLKVQYEKRLIDKEEFDRQMLVADRQYATEKQSLGYSIASDAIAIAKQGFADNKAMMIVALALEKGIAIARIMANTEVAASAAIASAAMIPVVGAATGIANAAAIRAMSYVSIGMVAASGLMEGMQIAGARASGGPVTAGETYLVGERGPELMTAGANGYVTPNNKIGGGITINQVNHIDARGADQGVEQKIYAAMKQTREATKADILKDMNRGGTFAMASGRR